MDRKMKIKDLYRGKTPYDFNEKKSTDLIFQTLAWEKEDREIDDDSDKSDGDQEYDYASFEEGSQQSKKKYKAKQLILRTHGLTREGISVCLEITGFQPYFLLKLPPTWGKSKVKALENKILSKIGYRKKELSFKVVKMKKLYYFDNYKDHLFLKIFFKTEGARYEAMKKLIPNETKPISAKVIEIQKTFPFSISGSKIKLDVYETRMDTIIRFIHLSGIQPAGIIRVNTKELNKSPLNSSCQIVRSTDWKNIQYVDEDWVAPFRATSFDIECTSKDGSFPQASRKEDAIIQIASTTRFFGEKYCSLRHIVTLKQSNNIPDVVHEEKDEDGFTELVIVESFNTEKEVLKAWARHIVDIDSDVLIGYNTFGFDNKYIYDRSKLLRCEGVVSKLGRIKNKECKLITQNLSSSAMGDNRNSYYEMNGRIQIDLLPVVRNGNIKYSSYKLDNIAKNILGSRKNDLPPEQIFARFRSGKAEDIKVIAEYCIQDCLLVNDLYDKLDIFVNSLGMANVCLIPTNLLFTRGQGIKVFSKIAKKCMERNTAFPTLVKIEHEEGKNIGYEGAIVLPPIPGFYDDPIAVLDYGSLYPASMIEFNISYETYINNDEHKNMSNCRLNSIEFDEDYNNENKGKVFKKCTFAELLKEEVKDEKERDMLPNLDNKGILPSLLMEVLAARKIAKKQMAAAKTPFEKSVYNGKQLALKVTANSVYGYTGAKFSDLRFMDLAASTTAVGRKRIHTAKDFAEKNYLGAVVVYGDTDSIFINFSECKEVKGLVGKKAVEASIKLGEKVADYITSQIRKPQVLEYEKTFWPFMIISKKRYAGNKYEFSADKYKFNSNGLVTTRRDNAPILKKIYKKILDILFFGEDSATAVKKAVKLYKESVTDLLKGNVELNDLVVSKTLKTNYKTPTTIAHKVLAEKIKKRDPGNAPVSNDRIPYIFIDSKELKCYKCNKSVTVKRCKCKVCMNLYCSDHLRKHKNECVPLCRICWTNKNSQLCDVCGGNYCKSHRTGHKCTTINEEALQGDLLETPDFIRKNNLKIDYRYYLDHQIRKPVSQIFELIKETKNKDPLKQILIKDNNRINKVRSITDFFKV